MLGDDHYEVNPYYARAETYYRQQKAPLLVTQCRSLRSVSDYLAQHRPAGRPWDSIHLVVHGNAWTGMGLPVLPGDSTRTTPATLAAAQAAGLWQPLPRGSVGASTVVLLHGCALGRDTALLLALSQALGDTRGRYPRVVSGRSFNLYEADASGRVRQCQARFWYVNYPSYQRPPDSLLARMLTRHYPAADIDWSDALRRRRPRWPGDAYWRLVAVPVHWTVTYPDSADCPGLDEPAAQQRWLAGQAELQNAIARMGLDAAQFRWSFRHEVLRFDDGPAEPAIVAEGQTSVCCVLRETAQETEKNNDFTVVQYRKSSWFDTFCLQ